MEPLESTPPPIDDFTAWLEGFMQPTVLVELLALAVCIFLAWGVAASARRALGMQEEKTSVLFGRSVVDGGLFPALLLAMGYFARSALLKYVPLAVFKVVIPVLVSLVVIRVGVKVLQVALHKAPWVKVLERSLSWLA